MLREEKKMAHKEPLETPTTLFDLSNRMVQRERERDVPARRREKKYEKRGT